MDSESALGTADNGIDKDVRLAAAPTVPTATRELAAQANLGHEGAAEFVQDAPIPYEMVRPDSLTLPVNIRRAATTGTPPLMTMLQSGGWTIKDSVADTVTTGAPVVGDFDATASILGAADYYGGAVLVETVAATTWQPSLLASYDDAPDKTCIPVMDLPAISAVGGDIIRTFTATVNPSVVAATETLTFNLSTRGDYTTAPDLDFTYSGCAMADLGAIEISREGGAVVLNPTFHVSDIAVGASTLNAASFAEGDGTDATTSHIQRQESSNFKFEMAAYAPAGGITYATHEFISATITPNVTTIPIDGIGSTSCLNGAQGYVQRIAMPTVDVTILADHDWIDSATKGMQAVGAAVNQLTYLGFVWATGDVNVTSSAIWLPACRQIAPPEFDLFNDRYQLVTLHFGATAPKYTGGATVNTSAAMSPIVIAIAGEAA
jgi:hypothetical protein